MPAVCCSSVDGQKQPGWSARSCPEIPTAFGLHTSVVLMAFQLALERVLLSFLLHQEADGGKWLGDAMGRARTGVSQIWP